MIKIGTKDVDKLYFGQAGVDKLYLGNTEIYSSAPAGHKCTITGLGNQDPATVTFQRDEGFPTTFEEVNVNGNIFIKFPKFYRKVESVVDGQITSFSIADAKLDNSYELYPCFKKYNGLVETGQEADYVLIGKYCCSSSSVANSVNATYVTQWLETGRTNARALGSGYQLYDWKLQKLFVDLSLAVSQRFNFNSGQTITEYLGVNHLDETIWIDGVVQHNDGNWGISYDPSKYVSSSTPTTDGYTEAGYKHPTSGSYCIKKLGYNISNPFFNYPEEQTGDENYGQYYCDRYYALSDSLPVRSNVGYADAFYGIFYAYANYYWSRSAGVRLCYIP